MTIDDVLRTVNVATVTIDDVLRTVQLNAFVNHFNLIISTDCM